MHILDTIDQAIDGRCPCGADPRPGSAYCGPDCEPTHISDDTDTNGPGRFSHRHGPATPARWRPDLAINDEDDFGYEPINANTHYEGPFFARLLRPLDADGLHLRLDDGHRWVGHTIDRFDGQFTSATVARMKRVWRRLERQLTDTDQAVIEQPPPDLRPALLRDVPREVQDRWEWWCDTCRRPLPTARWHGPFSYHFLDDHVSFHRIRPRAGADAEGRSAADLLRLAREERRRAAERLDAARSALGIPDWERRCRECDRYGAPLTGIRVAGPPRLADRRGTAVVQLELGQVCPHCHAQYPGPPLVMVSERRTAVGEWHYRLHARVGDRKYSHHTVVLESSLEAAHDPAAYVRREWDRMEAQLLRRIADDESTAEEPDSDVSACPAVGVVLVAPVGSDPANPEVWQAVGTATHDGLRLP